jgi:myo-inositol-1(or 4)-monophosphatase
LLPGAFAAHRAGHKASRIDLVTDFDRRSETAILASLTAARPGDTIIGEEGGTVAGKTGRRWFVDPLDGTTNFSHGLPFFTVSIALEVDGQLTVGVVFAPALGWLFVAARGEIAALVRDGASQPLQVSSTPVVEDTLLATGFPYERRDTVDDNLERFGKMTRQTHGVRRVGSASLDLAMVAAGWLDGYWEKNLKPWDIGAGALLVSESGGRISALDGGPFLVESGEILATNGHIHDALSRALL